MLTGLELRQGAFRWESTKPFFTPGGVTHWTRLPRGVGDASALEALEPRLGVALRSPVYWLATLCT